MKPGDPQDKVAFGKMTEITEMGISAFEKGDGSNGGLLSQKAVMGLQVEDSPLPCSPHLNIPFGFP